MKNYYDILEIPSSSSLLDIKKAFRKQAVKYHPDKHFGDDYFTNKFIEIKEAYDTLSDQNKKSEYDLKYKTFFSNTQETIKSDNFKKQKEKEKEEQFFYDPYKPFYSNQDRVSNETPQFNPKINHWGEVVPNDMEFFILPKKIGKIVSGFSTLKTSMNPPSGFFGSLFGSFKHSCSFMGVNGFALYKISGNRKTVTESIEINFNEVTDLLSVSQRRSYNHNYQDTAYGFEWSYKNKIIKDFNGTYYDKNDNPNRKEAHEYWANKWAERYWTIYLLDKMESELDQNGYIEFRIIEGQGYKPYIKLGIGKITFLTKKGEVIYNFNEIKNLYTKGTSLYIEHINYEKKFLFFESGDKNGIDLMHLSNRQFFLRALELLLGYKIN
nr:DnaJ domain-containing protein [Cytophagales bacterium]